MPARTRRPLAGTTTPALLRELVRRLLALVPALTGALTGPLYRRSRALRLGTLALLAAVALGVAIDRGEGAVAAGLGPLALLVLAAESGRPARRV
jgi:hypothetical protein